MIAENNTVYKSTYIFHILRDPLNECVRQRGKPLFIFQNVGIAFLPVSVIGQEMSFCKLFVLLFFIKFLYKQIDFLF